MLQLTCINIYFLCKISFLLFFQNLKCKAKLLIFNWDFKQNIYFNSSLQFQNWSFYTSKARNSLLELNSQCRNYLLKVVGIDPQFWKSIPHFRSVKWSILELKWGIEKNVLLKVSTMYIWKSFLSVSIFDIYCQESSINTIKNKSIKKCSFSSPDTVHRQNVRCRYCI